MESLVEGKTIVKTKHAQAKGNRKRNVSDMGYSCHIPCVKLQNIVKSFLSGFRRRLLFGAFKVKYILQIPTKNLCGIVISKMRETRSKVKGAVKAT